MDVLNGNLKAVEASGFRRCDFHCKIAAKVLIDDAIQCSEERKHVGDEVVFIISEAVPICSIGLEVNHFNARDAAAADGAVGGPHVGNGRQVQAITRFVVEKTEYPLADALMHG